jgi:hypothetical protein
MNNENDKNEIIEAKNELINLYLLIKPKKLDDVLNSLIKYIYNSSQINS